MRSEVKEDDKEVIIYPCLMKRKWINVERTDIVLFMTPTEGVLVSTTNIGNPIGKYQMDLDVKDYKIFNGTVTLSNI